MSSKKSLVNSYEELLTKYKENTLLSNINSIIFWDYEVMMPDKGVAQRSEERSFLEGIIHERRTSPQIGKLLKSVKSHNDYSTLSFPQKRNIELLQRHYDKDTTIPKEFAVKLTRHSALATEKWKKAKKQADFSIFKEPLKKMIELKKQEAHYYDPDKDPFDVLLDHNEKGLNKKLYDEIFSMIKQGLLPLIEKCTSANDQPDELILQRKCPVSIQKKLVKDIAHLVNYDLAGGRIDEAVHPFTTGYYDDIRITVRYNPTDFTQAFFAALHESGHALYNQNYPEDHKWEPIGAASSSAMHEGQARFIENIIGRSRSFWKFYYPRFQELTGDIFADVPFDEFIRAINIITPSKIRIHADPVTYSMHIILRYELEKALFEDNLSVDELPQFWNEKMEDYLGVEIENDAEGILQDTHYAWGLFGYFPTYSLGSYYNGQFVKQLDKDIPDWKDHLQQGNISIIHDWLNESIRSKGNLFDPLDLVEEVTGEPFTPRYFIDEMHTKYTTIYDL